MWDTLLVDGTDLSTIVSCVQTLDGNYNAAVARGDDITIPGVDGEIFTDKPYGAGTVDYGLVFAGDTTAEFNDQYRVLKTLIRPGKQLTLTRRVSYSTGNESHTAVATYASGLTMSPQLMRFGKVAVSFKILSGVWYAASPTTVSVGSGFSTTLAAAGETRTHKMTITVPGGSSITNSTNGFTLSLDMSSIVYSGGTAPTDPVTINVLNMTATQDGNDVSNCMTWNQRYPMRLEPGNNTIFPGAGITASFSYYPAYL